MAGFSLLSCMVGQSHNPTNPTITSSPSPTWTGTILTDYAIPYPEAEVTATAAAKLAMIEAKNAKKQAAVPTALAYMGDKADNLRFMRVIGPDSKHTYSVYFQQTYKDIPVNESHLIVYTNPETAPRIQGKYYSDITLPSITPTITLSEAITIAVNTIGIQGDYKITNETGLTVSYIPTEIDNKFVLTWHIYLQASCPYGWWVVQLNAITNNVIFVNYHIIGFSDPPSPCPTPMLGFYPTPIPAP